MVGTSCTLTIRAADCLSKTSEQGIIVKGNHAKSLSIECQLGCGIKGYRPCQDSATSNRDRSGGVMGDASADAVMSEALAESIVMSSSSS